jgi:asparagine synthase (glutamine-hydrolysing)
MCGICGIVGLAWEPRQIESMIASQHHRGPDATGEYRSPSGRAALGHNRLSIIDLSEAGRQPMSDATGRYWLVFNGEIYNYLELRRELESEVTFRTRTDTEVVLAAFAKWGAGCLDRLLGMFAFAIWDEREQSLFAARDRFGVKPFYYHRSADGSLRFASEIKAIHAGGVARHANPRAWASYLADGLYEHSEETFWEGIYALPAGHLLNWRDGRLNLSCWYDLRDRGLAEIDARPLEVVEEEYRSLLEESVRLRFRSDVPVGINLSGGLDSSTLLGLVQKVQGEESEVKAFTFVTGDPAYDELPWVRAMLERTHHPSIECRLSAAEVPDLAEQVQHHQDEPFGGLPTLAYARVFEQARAEGVIVLLDGQGMDEQWAGYDYYASGSGSTVQGVSSRATRPECLQADFRNLSRGLASQTAFADSLRNLQYRDIRHTKIPRALRFSDRVSMRSSTELREPFLDHRLVELAFRQASERKIYNGTSKWLLRRIAGGLLPYAVVEAPKRPLQTPQREWLRGPLREWAEGQIEVALSTRGGDWLEARAVRNQWQAYCAGDSDNSFFIWQWISIGLLENSQSHRDDLKIRKSTRAS